MLGTVQSVGKKRLQSAWLLGAQVDEAEVDRLHKIFYNKVAELFTQHKDSFKGYERVKLVMIE